MVVLNTQMVDQARSKGESWTAGGVQERGRAVTPKDTRIGVMNRGGWNNAI